MNRIATLTAALMMLMAGTAQANLYKEGTELHGYVAQLDQYLPEQVEVFFINRTEPTALLNQLDPAKVVDTEIQTLMNQAVDFLSAPKDREYRVFAKTFRANKQANGKSLCAIYATDTDLLKTSHMHEMMHCAAYVNSEAYGKNGITEVFQPLFAKSFKDSLGRDVETGRKVVEIMEAHAHIMAEVIWQKTGITADRHNKARREQAVYPLAAAKTATARGIELCQERICPIDPSELATVLVNDKAFVEALRNDLTIANTYEMAQH